MKKAAIIISTFFLVVLTICGYIFLNNVFPKAEPINLPEDEEILSFFAAEKNGKEISMDEKRFEVLLEQIKATKPTRKMSVNDYPTGDIYYIINIGTSSGECEFFIYEENGETYIEFPYEGIYKSNADILDLF